MPHGNHDQDADEDARAQGHAIGKDDEEPADGDDAGTDVARPLHEPSSRGSRCRGVEGGFTDVWAEHPHRSMRAEQPVPHPSVNHAWEAWQSRIVWSGSVPVSLECRCCHRHAIQSLRIRAGRERSRVPTNRVFGPHFDRGEPGAEVPHHAAGEP